MARESIHKARPTSELNSRVIQQGRRRSNCSIQSSSNYETDDSDQTIRPVTQRTIEHQQEQEEEVESSQPIESLQDEIFLLLLESHNDTKKDNVSVNHQPKTEKNQISSANLKKENTSKDDNHNDSPKRQHSTSSTYLNVQDRPLLYRTISLPSSGPNDKYDNHSNDRIRPSKQQKKLFKYTSAKMQRFRKVKEGKSSFDSEELGSSSSSSSGGKEKGILFPSSSSAINASSSSSGLFNISLGGGGKKNKGKARALSSIDGTTSSSSIYGIPSSGSTSSLKVPKPRNWVNSLMSVGSSNNSLSKLATSSNSSKPNNGFIGHVRSNSFNTLHATPPVSSLVLQTGFEDENADGQLQSPDNIALWRQLDRRGESPPAMGRQASNMAALGRSATRTTVGTLHMATMSTPNLPSSTSDEWAERLAAPLLVRNLDDEPRGTMTPEVNSEVNSYLSAKSKRKMTNPWAKLNEKRLQEIHGDQSSHLINPEEEEQMLDDAVQKDRMEGRMKNEEQAVLDMLDQMNETVDTFEKPNVTRTKSMMMMGDGSKSSVSSTSEIKVSTYSPRPSLKRSNTNSASTMMEGKEAKRRPISMGGDTKTSTTTVFSGEKPSVRAFASMFETESGQSDALLTRAKSQFGRKKSSLELKETIKMESPKLGSVKKAIEEREKIDNQSVISSKAPVIQPDASLNSTSGSFLQSMASTLRNRTSFPSFRLASTAEPSEAKANESSSSSNVDDIEKPSKPSTLLAPPPTSATSNIFLSRHDTMLSTTSTKHDPRSPNQESYISSVGNGSSLWSRRDSVPDSPFSLPTSPGVQSDVDATSPFGFGSGKRRFGTMTLSEGTEYQPVPPLLRRLRTDFTQATSVSSTTDTEKVDTVMTDVNQESDQEGDETVRMDRAPLKREKSVAFSTFSKRSDTLSSIKSKTSSTSTIPPTPPTKEIPLKSFDETIGRSKSPLRVPLSNGNEQGVSPSLLGTPKRAKDLIQFFEQTSAPNSPSLNRTPKPTAKQFSPMKGESPAQMANRFRQALGSSTLTNRLIDNDSSHADENAIQEKIVTVGRGRRRLQGNIGRVGVAVGSGGGNGNPFSDSYDPSSHSYDSVGAQDDEDLSDEDTENQLPSSNFPSSNGGKKSRTVSSGAFLGKLLGGSSPEGKKKEEAPNDAPGLTESGRNSGSSSNKGSNFRSGVKSIMNALSQGVNITGGDAPTTRGGSGGGGGRSGFGGDDQGGRRPTSWQSAHQSGFPPPPTSYRDPMDARKNFPRRMSEQSEIESALSTRTVGTTQSFRQKTERGQNLRIDTASTLALMGQPNVEPFRTGLVYYFNVHVEKPIWQRAQAVLLPSALALSWIPVGGGRVSVVLDLSACREVHSVPGPDHPSSGDDYGAFIAREQGLRRINPLQMIFDDGVERLAVDTPRERVVWVASVWDALGVRSSRSGQPARSRQVSTNYSMLGGVAETATDIAQLHLTTPRPNSPMSPPPTNFNVQISDDRRFMPSGLAAVPLESSMEDVTQLEITSPDRDRYEAVQMIAAEELPPPPPPKEKVKRKRFVDESKVSSNDDESPKTSDEEKKLSQETLVIHHDKTPPNNNASQETFFSSNSAREGSQVDDDFGPRSPRSEAVLNFPVNTESDRDIVPADSASQRPARSLTGTILSRFTALAGYRSDKAEKEEESNTEDSELIRTPAQTIRDRFVDGDEEQDGNHPQRMLDTVMEETLSQAATTQLQRQQNTSRKVSSKRRMNVGGGPGSALSVQSSGSVNSQELAKLLQFIEQQNEDRQRRDRQMEEQLRAFQNTVHSLQQRGEYASSSIRKHSRRSSSEAGDRNSQVSRRSGTATAAAAASVAADAAALAEMQEKLDKVLSMVANVSEGQQRLEDINEDGTPRGPQPPTFNTSSSSNTELERIEKRLGSLVNQIQFNTLPQSLRADNRSIHVDGGARPLDGRDRAILADRIVHGTRPTNRRMSAPPDMTPDGLSEGNEGFLTPLTGERAGIPPSDMADLFSPATGMVPSHSESGFLAGTDRIPARSWLSADGIPSPPANTERNRSLLNEEGRGPVERNAYGMMTPRQDDRFRHQNFDPLAPGDSLSNVSIDMEAEIRRRRMRNAVGARDGGWYTPRPGGGIDQSNTPAMFNQAQNSGGNSGLGLSMPHEKERQARVSQSIQTPAQIGSLNPDIAILLDAIKDNEESRKAQRQQQQDIARYLNELNSWLEKDVIDRSKEWRTLAMGVTQLHDELNAIKGQGGAVGGGGGGLMAMPMAQIASTQQHAHPDGAGPQVTRTALPNANGGVGGPRGMPSDNNNFNQSTLDPYNQNRALDEMYAAATNGGGGYGQMALTSAALEQLGADAPAPINVPRPGSPVKRSGTRTWRAQGGAGALRNDDVWENSGIAEVVKEKKRLKEEKKAERRASRRKSFGTIITAAGISALIAAGYHEYQKYKERQRQEGKPEEASREPDERTGQHVKHDQVPAKEAEKISKAAKSGDEAQVRQAILDAASAGAGAAAISQLVNELEKIQASSAAEATDDRTLQGSYDSAGTTIKRSAGKLSNDSKYSVGEETLREAVRKIDTQDGGGGDRALALAIEEILKHLLEKKEDERRMRREQEEAEALREEQRRQDLEERESRLSSLRDQERSELVETIFAKMQAEKERQDAEAAARQREMDPKSAIESLVSAINMQRQSDASQRAAADASIKQMAEELVRTTSDANSKLVEAVHTAAREMLRNNVEAHADDLKRLIGRDVSAMFEDVGKIREAKRALELEMAELFHFKSKHLAEIEHMKLANHASSAMPAPAPAAIPIPAPMPMSMPMQMPGIMPMGMGMGGMPGMGGQPIFNISSAPPMPDIPAMPQSQPKASAIPPALPPAGGGGGGLSALKKKDFMSPFSINFGAR